MTLYYTLVFILLLVEMFSFTLLVAPIPGPIKRRALKFIATSYVSSKVKFGLKIMLVCIFILFLDSLNRVYRVSALDQAAGHGGRGGFDRGGGGFGISDRADTQATRFYAQRNFYLCGFTLFLAFITNRTYSLMFDYYVLEEQMAKLKRASTTKDENEKAEILSADKDAEIEKLKNELKAKKHDIDALKSQCEGLQREYNRMGDWVNVHEQQQKKSQDGSVLTDSATTTGSQNQSKKDD